LWVWCNYFNNYHFLIVKSNHLKGWIPITATSPEAEIITLVIAFLAYRVERGWFRGGKKEWDN
jgi:hypothetical protein